MQWLHALQLTISDKTVVIANHNPTALHIAAALRRLSVPAKTEPYGLDCGALFAGGCQPNKSHQNLRIANTANRTDRIGLACRHDERAAVLATTGAQPMQIYAAPALGTPLQASRRMRTNMCRAIYTGSAQPCPTTLVRSHLGAKNDSVVRVATDSIDAWLYLWKTCTPSTRSLHRSAWMAISRRFPRRLHEIRPNGLVSGTIHWAQLVGWLPALPNY